MIYAFTDYYLKIINNKVNWSDIDRIFFSFQSMREFTYVWPNN